MTPQRLPSARLEERSRAAPLGATIQAARDGSPDALSSLFADFAETVFRVAFRLTRSADEAEDILQDVFVRLPEALHRFDGRSSFQWWLTRVTTRAALSQMRAARRRAHQSLSVHDDPPTRARCEPLEEIALGDALARLPAEARTILVLRAEGYSHAEIGELLSIRPGTSEVRLFRAREALRALMESDR